MGRDFTFHIEEHAGGRWDVPAGLEPRSAYAHAGEFAWVPASAPGMRLFFGEGALFPFIPGAPPDWEHSAIFRWLAPWYDFAGDEFEISWLPFEDLLLDEWDRTTLIVSQRVKARYAAWFGDGAGAFPRDAVAGAGLSERDLFDGGRERVVGAPIDRTFGRGRYEIEQAGDETLVDVTWAETIAGLMGDRVTREFRAVRRFGPDAALRVISTFS